MNQKRKNYRRKTSQLDRIERKCDRILAELLIVRQNTHIQRKIDHTIDNLHYAARKMREQCEEERNSLQKMFGALIDEQ